MQLSQPLDWIGKRILGYVVNSDFSDTNQSTLNTLNQEIKNEFGDVVFCPPKKSLHITLLDWIAPLVDYGGRDKNAIFAEVQPSYDKALRDILSSVESITVHFNLVKVSPSTIYIEGHDKGEFQRIREQFLDRVELLPGTKMPPTIIHSSLARFMKPIELGPVESFLAGKTLNFNQKITGFRLIRTIQEPLLEFEVVKRYKLK